MKTITTFYFAAICSLIGGCSVAADLMINETLDIAQCKKSAFTEPKDHRHCDPKPNPKTKK